MATKQYVYPKIATKEDQYMCPECGDLLVLCKGSVRAHYFRHKSNSTCSHYGSPNESVIHKDAKLLLQTLLRNKTPITLVRNCSQCRQSDEFAIPEITDGTSDIILEYRFEHHGATKIADVAYLDSGEMVCLFEICHTHATEEQARPEPWFEINAKGLIMLANQCDTNSQSIIIPDMRTGGICSDCTNAKEIYELKRNKACAILAGWFSELAQRNNSLPPFEFHEYDGILGGLDHEEVTNYYCTYDENTGLTFDCIIWDKADSRFYVDFTLNPIKYTDELLIKSESRDIYYIDMEWILSQAAIPTFIPNVHIYDGNPYSYNLRSNRTIQSLCANKQYTYSDELAYISVPYNNRHMIKVFGGKWDPIHKLCTFNKRTYYAHGIYIEQCVGQRMKMIPTGCDGCHGTAIHKSGKWCINCSNMDGTDDSLW